MSTTGNVLVLGAVGAAALLLWRTQGRGSQAIEDLLDQVIDLLPTTQTGASGVGKPQPSPTGGQNDGATPRTNTLGDPLGTTYQVGAPHPTDPTPGLRVIAVGDKGTSPLFSSLPNAAELLAQFRRGYQNN